MTTAGLTSLIGTLVAPVALITPTAILLGNFMNKYTGIAGQMRLLSAEYRAAGTSRPRRHSIRGQLRLFHRRVTAMWAASGALLMALLSFLVTVLSVVFDRHEARSVEIGAVSIVIGLAFILVSIVLELWEIGLARLTIAGELNDIFSPTEDAGPL